MDFKKHFETAWQNTLKFIGPVLLLTLVQVIIVLFSLGILAPVTTAGYMQSLLRAQREGRPPEIRDLFSQMSLFLPLFGFFVLVMIMTGIGFMFLVLPGLAVALFIIFATLYMIPLMTDKDRGIMDALKESWEMATREPITDQIVISVAYLVIMSLGGSVPFAILITQPFAMFLLLSVYEERLQGRSGRKNIEHTTTTPPPPPTP
ncbi:MAG: hypothetical protein Q8R88_07850 [Desulfoprunum sp.]|nr:hypothetical protein [Desulfoprunum sp.]